MLVSAVDIEWMYAISREASGVTVAASFYGREAFRFDGRDKKFCYTCAESRLNDGLTVCREFRCVEMAVRVDQHVLSYPLFCLDNKTGYRLSAIPARA